MKFSIVRESILNPLQSIIGVVERRQTQPVLSNLLLKVTDQGIELTATDNEIEMVAKIGITAEAFGEITVPAKKFFDICKSLPDETIINVDLQQDKLRVRAAKSRFILSTLPATEFPNVENISIEHELVVQQQEFKKMIEQTHFAVAQQDVRYFLNGLLLEFTPDCLRAVATDGHRMALAEIDLRISINKKVQAIVPRKAVQELLRLLENNEDEVRLQICKNHLRVIFPTLIFTTKLIDGKFPDYNNVIPKMTSSTLIVDRLVLKQALTRAAILSNEKYKGVRIQLDSGKMLITSHNPEQDEAEEEISVEYNAAPLNIGFNVVYMLDVLNAIAGDRILINLADGIGSSLVRDLDSEKVKYVIMPMRI